MRAFLAIDLPDKVKDYLYDFQKKLKKDYVKINWVAKKNLHLTLKFFGEVDEKKLEELKAELRKIKQNPFMVKLKGIGFFPDEKAPNVIWVGIQPEKDVIALQQTIDEALLLSFPSDQKFQSHLTIGRIKGIKKPKEFAEAAKALKIDEIEFEISSFKLMESTLAASGPSYRMIEEFKWE
ncbi:MAG TPA: RNA 2',3'-cyclic phosphodiesterase [Nanoarchaeota archaeon]|nr:RNA 2',3'-cyclic phosphodiesterase [Nanoarchaeota archaeon]